MPGGAGPFQNAPDYKYEKRSTYSALSQDRVNSLETTLAGKDKQFGAAGQFKSYDLTPPIRLPPARYTVAVNSQTWVTRQPIYILKPSVNTSKFLGYGAESPPSTAGSASKLLGYAVLEPAPGNFRRTSDWGDNPRAPKFPISLRTHIDPLKINLLGQDALPFRQTEWPNPTLRVLAKQDWTAPLNVALNLFGDVPFHQTNWPVPKGEPPTPQDWSATVPLNLLGQDALPFAQFDWPNPQRPRYSIELYTWVQSLTNSTLGAVAPFAQYDWPNPRGADPAKQDWAAPLNVALNLFGNVPFNQTDWPVPKGAPPIPQDWSWPVQLNLIGRDALPFTQHDWPNPRGAPPRQGWTAPLNPALNLFGDLPFNQTDWPVPRGPDWGVLRGIGHTYTPPQQLLQTMESSKFLGYGAYSAPDDAAISPKFLGSGALSPPWTAASVSKLLGYAVLAPVVEPFYQTDWPNPRGPLFPTSLLGSVQGVAINLIPGSRCRLTTELSQPLLTEDGAYIILERCTDVPSTGCHLLTEAGAFLLTESGAFIVLEHCTDAGQPIYTADPYTTPFNEWADHLVSMVPGTVIMNTADEANWREWAAAVVNSAPFAQKDVPSPDHSEDWREWADRLANATGSGV